MTTPTLIALRNVIVIPADTPDPANWVMLQFYWDIPPNTAATLQVTQDGRNWVDQLSYAARPYRQSVGYTAPTWWVDEAGGSPTWPRLVKA